jgi:hypothetical protein
MSGLQATPITIGRRPQAPFALVPQGGRLGLAGELLRGSNFEKLGGGGWRLGGFGAFDPVEPRRAEQNEMDQQGKREQKDREGDKNAPRIK